MSFSFSTKLVEFLIYERVTAPRSEVHIFAIVFASLWGILLIPDMIGHIEMTTLWV